MTSQDNTNTRDRLLAMRSAIESFADSPDGVGDVVELDPSRTGRLTRMDALQLQAMAKAGQARARLALAKIDAALKRLEGGTYGECLDCGEAIATARLEANPTATRCVRCEEAREVGAER